MKGLGRRVRWGLSHCVAGGIALSTGVDFLIIQSENLTHFGFGVVLWAVCLWVFVEMMLLVLKGPAK